MPKKEEDEDGEKNEEEEEEEDEDEEEGEEEENEEEGDKEEDKGEEEEEEEEEDEEEEQEQEEEEEQEEKEKRSRWGRRGGGGHRVDLPFWRSMVWGLDSVLSKCVLKKEIFPQIVSQDPGVWMSTGKPFGKTRGRFSHGGLSFHPRMRRGSNISWLLRSSETWVKRWLVIERFSVECWK